MPLVPPDPDLFLRTAAAAVRAGDSHALTSLFAKPAPYLFEMAKRRGGLPKFHVSMIPAPPGWHARGDYWIVFHTPQTIEEDHDTVYELRRTPTSWAIGPEIPEDDLGGWKIASQSYAASLYPDRHLVEVQTTVRLNPGGPPKALLFRLNDTYKLAAPNLVEADETAVPQPKNGSLVRAGGLLIPWTDHPAQTYRFSYSATLPQCDDDEIVAHDAYVTAWWLPSLGRLPFKVDAAIEGPANWVIRGEGTIGPVALHGDRKVCRFVCELPISYPKIIAGAYREAASAKVNGDTFKIYQLDPIDLPRAQRDLANTEQAAAFYERTLGKLPFRGYEAYDAERYYGIESYSHTLLKRDATHFISHEMGHTYFGGLAPCPYVNDCWNEGITQYIDSVANLGDKDRTLEMGLATADIRVSLKNMPVPWSYNSTAYYRGAYTMKMLESEIGADNVLKALKHIAFDRIGKDTRWDDLRPYFERAAGKPLDWFWRQWIDGAAFPTFKIESDVPQTTKAGFRSFITVSQSGSPFRVRLIVRALVNSKFVEKLVTMDTARATFPLDTPTKPTMVGLRLFPYTLGRLASQLGGPPGK